MFSSFSVTSFSITSSVISLNSTFPLGFLCFINNTTPNTTAIITAMRNKIITIGTTTAATIDLDSMCMNEKKIFRMVLDYW